MLHGLQEVYDRIDKLEQFVSEKLNDSVPLPSSNAVQKPTIDIDSLLQRIVSLEEHITTLTSETTKLKKLVKK